MDAATLSHQIKLALPFAKPFKGICYRNVGPKYYASGALSTEGSKRVGGRFNPKGLGLLYLSCDLHTCIEETTKSLSQTADAVATALPRLFFAVEVKLSRVLDLTDETVRQSLGVTEAQLTAKDWSEIQSSGQEALTQSIGWLAQAAGFEGLLVPSAVFQGKNLNIFIDDLIPPAYVKMLPPA